VRKSLKKALMIAARRAQKRTPRRAEARGARGVSEEPTRAREGGGGMRLEKKKSLVRGRPRPQEKGPASLESGNVLLSRPRALAGPFSRTTSSKALPKPTRREKGGISRDVPSPPSHLLPRLQEHAKKKRNLKGAPRSVTRMEKKGKNGSRRTDRSTASPDPTAESITSTNGRKRTEKENLKRRC